MEIVNNILPLKEFHRPSKPCVPLSIQQIENVNLFNKGVLTKTIKFEEVPCLCGNDEFDLIARYDRYSMLQQTVMCRRCGLILSNPRMTKEEYENFYRRDTYFDCYVPSNYLNSDGLARKYARATGQHILDTVLKIKGLNEIKNVLEFGVAGGWNLIPFKEEGISVTGYDYSPNFVALGRERGLNLIQGTIGSIVGKYDIIILSHVIEHLTNLIGDIKELKQHLNPKGIFYIAVPDIRIFNRYQLQNAHTYYFTLRTLHYYMAKCGLRLVHSEPSQIIHLAAVFLNEPLELSVEFLSGHREEMIKIIKRYCIREFLDQFFQSNGSIKIIKKIIKRVMPNKFVKLKSWIYGMLCRH
ncbi:MAG: class I SAM-dependent methyltransferase [Candidatus Omnitrophota bacterium]|nr:class I SAM-dependent methyltransferase [Candidatus Omnitrophota bacterium]